MGGQQIVNITLLLWGSMFCLLATLYFSIVKDYDRIRGRWMMSMQFSTALLLLSDAMAYIFRGRGGTLYFWGVRISNFAVFFLTDLTFLFFHRYVCSCLMSRSEEKALKRVNVVRIACWIGMALVVISQFTGLYYSFDAQNLYHRSAFYPLSMAVPTLGMCVDYSLLMKYRKRISKRLLVAICSYIFLPMISLLVQAVHYGWSLINLSIGVSMILMFLVSTTEQNETLRRLERSRAQIAEKLEIATVLNRCVEKLSGGRDLDQATQELLEVINEYFKADRSYIFEIDASGRYIVNTHEAVRNGVTEEKDNLQKVPIEVVDVWVRTFEKEDVYKMRDLEQERGTSFYEILKPQNVQQLLAVPLRREKKNIGFLGVDNPREHFEDPTLLSSIQFFVTNSLEQKKVQENLAHLSYTDMLTQLSNRNRYIETTNRWHGLHLKQTGCIYMDLNGLKHCNDTLGHEAGDDLIRRAAAALNEVFPGQAYRIGGDEFVVLLRPIGEEMFAEKVVQLRAALEHHQVSAAVGSVWEAAVDDLDAFLREADDRMYQEKSRIKAGRS